MNVLCPIQPIWLAPKVGLVAALLPFMLCCAKHLTSFKPPPNNKQSSSQSTLFLAFAVFCPVKILLSPFHSFFTKTIFGFDILANILTLRVFFCQKKLSGCESLRDSCQNKKALRLFLAFAVFCPVKILLSRYEFFSVKKNSRAANHFVILAKIKKPCGFFSLSQFFAP